VSSPPSTPDKPIASSPTARSAATTARLAGPASTISTTSGTPGGVTRRPSGFSTGRPRRRDSALTAWPPPCTTTRGSSGLRASAQAASHSGRSSSFPPNLTTRTLSMIPTLKGGLGTTLSLRTAHCRAQASAWESRAAELPSLRCSAYEPQGLGEPEHDVEVLHGLPRRSFHQVAGEPALTLQRRPQFGEMAMRVAHGVGAVVLRHFSEQQLALGMAARAGDARRRVDHDFARRVDEPALRQRDQRDERGGRVA